MISPRGGSSTAVNNIKGKDDKKIEMMQPSKDIHRDSMFGTMMLNRGGSEFDQRLKQLQDPH